MCSILIYFLIIIFFVFIFVNSSTEPCLFQLRFRFIRFFYYKFKKKKTFVKCARIKFTFDSEDDVVNGRRRRDARHSNRKHSFKCLESFETRAWQWQQQHKHHTRPAPIDNTHITRAHSVRRLITIKRTKKRIKPISAASFLSSALSRTLHFPFHNNSCSLARWRSHPRQMKQ